MPPASTTATSTSSTAITSKQSASSITTPMLDVLDLNHPTWLEVASPVLPPATKIPLQWSDINPLRADELRIWREPIDDSQLPDPDRSLQTQSDAVLSSLDAEEGMSVGVESGAAFYRGSDSTRASQLRAETVIVRSVDPTHVALDASSETLAAQTPRTVEGPRAVATLTNANNTFPTNTGKAKKRQLLTGYKKEQHSDKNQRKVTSHKTKTTVAREFPTENHATHVNAGDYLQYQDFYFDDDG
ncbi:hypothetical protein B0A48_17298 [Cryoendolithus antarcticus]|uniref:Uncharacterized protein n=1 Tax=Cryoendolithus antarcticus TaxID=1507870 RepID=A0A1V8SBT7_9PEZI|nr:hypothetical protein B0A48_17298 [Cryoendolithus antarcticus]